MAIGVALPAGAEHAAAANKVDALSAMSSQGLRVTGDWSTALLP
jgi:hypothetical protein